MMDGWIGDVLYVRLPSPATLSRLCNYYLCPVGPNHVINMACPNVPSPIYHTHIVNSQSRNGDKGGAQEFNFRSAVLHAINNLNISKGCFIRESLRRKSLLLKLPLSDAALQGDTAVVFAQCTAFLRNALPYYNYVDVAITEGLTKMGKDLDWRKNMMAKDHAQGKLKAITYANNAGSSGSGSSSSSSNPPTTAPTKSTGKGKASAPAGPADNQIITSFLSKKGAPASHAASSSSASSSSPSSMMAAFSSNSAGGDSTHTDGGAKPKRKLISVEPDEE